MADPGDTRMPYVDAHGGRQATFPHTLGNTAEGLFAPARARIRSTATVFRLGVLVLSFGFLLRLLAALVLSPHVDEASSILAAQAVAEKGLPVLPSGTVYFQGTPLSYLLQPFFWLGWSDLHNLELMRLIPVIAGTVALYLSYRLAMTITGDARVGLLVTALVAIDPLSVQWSGHLRMYSLLQALTIGLAWAFIVLVLRGPSVVRVMSVVLLFWAAVFTHVGAALLGPALALAALLIFRRSVVKQWGLLVCLSLCALAPVTLLGLNQRLGTLSVSQRGEEPSTILLTFVGDNLLTPLARFNIPLSSWNWGSVLQTGNLFWLVPGLIVAASTIIEGRRLLRHPQSSPSTRVAVITLLSLYWLPMVAVGLFTVSPKERYLLNAHVLGYVFVATVLMGLSGWVVETSARERAWTSQLAGIGVSVALVLAIATGLVWRLDNPIVHPDYNVAMSYVADHHESGQPVVVALPPVADLALEDSDRDDLYFLAGAQDKPRAQRYTRQHDEKLIDYWVGVRSIVAVEELQMLLIENPDAWIVVDRGRLAGDWAFGGEFRQVLNSMTYPVLRTSGGGLVLRALPPASDSEVTSDTTRPPRDHPAPSNAPGPLIHAVFPEA